MSIRPVPGRRSFAGVAAVGLLTLAATSTSTARADVTPPQPTRYAAGDYIVMMKAPPAAGYRGGRTGYPATASPHGARFDAHSPASSSYRGYLTSMQRATARAVGAAPYYSYTTALDGFAAKLTGRQATALSHRTDVLGVFKDRVRHADDEADAEFLGLTGPLGLWRRLGGTTGSNGAGGGVVVGILDSGITPASPSFNAPQSGVPSDWHGVCRTGEGRSVGTFGCNSKLIGGRYYFAGWGGAAGVDPGEILSPADYEGHGTHVASEAAGDFGVHASVGGVDLGGIAGMAPVAMVASYKVCWEDTSQTNCSAYESDMVAAIDDAVADGVDVINMSIGGGPEALLDPVETAYMYAADAGVFVAVSGGNDGPTPGTVGHLSPWETTVAASTYKNYESTVSLGDGESFVGAQLPPVDVPATKLVLAADIPATGQSSTQARVCAPDTLDSSAAAGNIVVCIRGGAVAGAPIARVAKSAEVARAGGAAMVLVNDPAGGAGQGVVGDIHSVPTVHLDIDAYHPILDYVHTAGPGATATFVGGVGATLPDPPAIAGFSSRGPSADSGGDLLKPDIAAPGVDVIAATSPHASADGFAVLSGTSMASPHIAGLAALVLQRHPTWSPMEVKSAMMTTARDLTDTNDPFDQGSGNVNPQAMLDPGLVYNSGLDDWLRYLEGQGADLGVNPIAASNLNVPSIAVDQVAGSETVRRTVTNVTDHASTYRPRISGLPGFTVTVSPTSMTIPAGGSAQFTVALTRTTAPLNVYQHGSLTWRDGDHAVRIPVVVRPAVLGAPDEVSAARNGPTVVSVKAGYAGTLVPRLGGLVGPTDYSGTAAEDQDPFDLANSADYFHTALHPVSAYQVIRLQTIPAVPSDDLDLWVTDSSGNPVAASDTPSGAEQVTLSGLQPGATYDVWVQAFAVADASQPFTLRKFVSINRLSNFSISPASAAVTLGRRSSFTIRSTGLVPGTPYFGVIWWQRHDSNGPVIGGTVVTVK